MYENIPNNRLFDHTRYSAIKFSFLWKIFILQTITILIAYRSNYT